MASEWGTVYFEDLYHEPSKNGLTKPKKVRGAGFKFINMGEIFKFDRMKNIPCDRVPLKDNEKGFMLKPKDLLFARQSLVLDGAGKCAIFLEDDEPVCFESHLIRVRLDQKKCNPEFMHYYFQSPQGKALIYTIVEQGAGQAGIRGSDLRRLKVPNPSMEIQEWIVHSMRAFDDKIELNKKINQTLEQMAQALFKSWFVDFDPVFDNLLDKHDNNLEKAKAYLESKGAEDLCPKLTKRFEQRQQTKDQKTLPQDIHNLFPSDFEESEVGWIPKRWGSKTLYELAEFINGAAYKKFEPNTKGIGWPIIKIAELKGGITAKTGFSTVDMPEKYHLVDKDILFSWSGNPETSIDTFVWASGDAWLNQHIFKVVPNSLCSYSFILALLKHLKPAFTAIARDKQTTGLGHVTVKDLKDLQIVMPPKELISKLDEQLSSIYDHMFLNLKVNQALDQTKKTLLPKLINGTIKVGS